MTITRASSHVIACPAALAVMLLLASAGSAPAAFPGRNGLIVFRSNASEATTHQLFSIAPSGSGRRNLTRNPYTNVNGAWSPDGRRIAFVQPNSPGSPLVVMNSDGSAQRRLTDDKQWASDPSWSPGGSLIAYFQHYRPSPGVHVVAPDGTGDRLVAANIPGYEWPPGWSPDGRRLVVVREVGGGMRALTVLELDGRPAHDVARGAALANPAWAPDGGSILFALGSDGGYELRTVRPDGTGERPVAPGWRGVWSPDGGGLVTVRDVNTPTLLTVMRPDGTGRAVLSRRAFDWPTWSPDGRRVAFVEEPGQVFTAAPDGRARVRVTHEPAGTEVRRPSWSPDGRRILYQAFRDKNDADLYALDAVGGIRALTTTGVDEVDPAWSPDGSALAFVRGRPEEESGGIFVMDGTGKQLRRLTPSRTDSSPSWSPDGSRIAFARGPRGDGSAAVYVMRSDGSHVRRLGRGADPAWSPDGRTIAFVSDGGLSLMRPDGSHRREVVEAADTASVLGVDFEQVEWLAAPAWSPDGRRLAFVAYFQYGRQMDYMAALTVDLATTRTIAVRVTDILPDKAAVDWSPDGTSIVFGAGHVLVGSAAGGEPVDRTPTLPGWSTDVTWQPLCTARGTSRAERMSGSPGHDVVCGLAGDDRLAAGGGRDRVFGGAGDDAIDVRDGTRDIVGCGRGRDTVEADRTDLVGVDCEAVDRR
jgi:Tol biopolymer transport system component